jgi:septal ring factor EnvC (AmiA/AmiB activator)
MGKLQHLLTDMDNFLSNFTVVRGRVVEEIELLEAAAAAKAAKAAEAAKAAAARDAYRPLLSAVTNCLTAAAEVSVFKRQGLTEAARFKEVTQTTPVPFATAKEHYESYMKACQGGLYMY